MNSVQEGTSGGLLNGILPIGRHLKTQRATNQSLDAGPGLILVDELPDNPFEDPTLTGDIAATVPLLTAERPKAFTPIEEYRPYGAKQAARVISELISDDNIRVNFVQQPRPEARVSSAERTLEPASPYAKIDAHYNHLIQEGSTPTQAYKKVLGALHPDTNPDPEAHNQTVYAISKYKPVAAREVSAN